MTVLSFMSYVGAQPGTKPPGRPPRFSATAAADSAAASGSIADRRIIALAVRGPGSPASWPARSRLSRLRRLQHTRHTCETELRGASSTLVAGALLRCSHALRALLLRPAPRARPRCMSRIGARAVAA